MATTRRDGLRHDLERPVVEDGDVPSHRSWTRGPNPPAGTRLVHSLALLSCVSSLAYCAYFVARTAPARPGEISHIEFRPNPAVVPAEQGRLHDDGMVVHVFNTSDRPATILGMREFCSSACYSGSGLPLTIPARGSARLPLRIHVNTPGPISERVEFFTDDRAHPIITLDVVGNLQEPPASHVFDKLGTP